MISSDPSLEKPPDYSTVVDVPPCYEDAIKLSPTPIILPLKHAPTSDIFNRNAATNNVLFKNGSIGRNYSTQEQYDFSVPSSMSDSRQTAKSNEDASTSQNSSQNENTFAKVFRKSIRGIRRLRSGSEDSNGTCGNGQSSSLENGAVSQDRNNTESNKTNR